MIIKPVSIKKSLASFRHSSSLAKLLLVSLAMFALITHPCQVVAAIMDPLFAAPYLTSDAGTSVASLATGDFNRDGKLDLVIPSASGPRILIGRGNGLFDPSFGVPACTSQRVSVVDMNRDEKLDLVFIGESGACIAYGDGNGQFVNGGEVTTSPRVTSVKTPDMNGDGWPDIVVTFQLDGSVTVLYGRADGIFSDKRDFPVPSGLKYLETGDLNGDSNPDVVVSISDSGQILILLGQDDGTLKAGEHYTVGLKPNEVAIGDLNGDGKPDLAVVNGASNSVSTLFGTGDGTFHGRHDWEVGTSPTSIAMGDFNRDSRLDIAASNFYLGTQTFEGSVSVLLGAAGGTFPTRADFPCGQSVSWVIADDANQDGLLDLVVGIRDVGNVSVLLGHGDGSFGSDYHFDAGLNPISIVSGDFNADRIIDLAVTENFSASVSISIGVGNGRFRNRASFTVGEWPRAATAGDWNKDGFTDLAVAVVSGISTLLSTGAGGFGPASNYPVGLVPQGITYADVNHDLIPDLIAANPSQLAITVLPGTGDGTFGPPLNSSVGAMQQGPLVAADFNQDGNVDIAVARFAYPGYVSILLGRGDGTFGSQQDIPTTPGGNPSSIATGDVNSDGNPDLVVTNRLGATIMILLGRGDAVFSRAPTISAVPMRGCEAATLADFDGDGTLDLAVGSAANVQVRHGNGDGTFMLNGGYGTVRIPIAMAAADLDGDCRPDIAALQWGDGGPSSVTILASLGEPGSSHEARASLRGSPKVVPIGAGEPFLCVELEPVNDSFQPEDVDLATVTMRSPGTGEVSVISAVRHELGNGGNLNDNGASRLEVCFAREDIATLFSHIQGRQQVAPLIEGCLFGGGHFSAILELTVMARTRAVSATIRPNPMNPAGTLRYFTSRQGGVRIRIYDINGRLVGTVLDESLVPGGNHEVRLRADSPTGHKPLPSGMYFYRIDSVDGIQKGRFAVVK